jgi:cytochrome P450
LWRGGPGQWVVPRYAEVSALLRDQRLGQFRFADAYRLFTKHSLQHSLGDGPATQFIQRIVVGQDQPEHARLRRSLTHVLVPQVTPRLRAHIDEIVDRFLDPVLDRGSADFVRDVALPVPLTVLCDLLDIPPEDREDLASQALNLNRIFAPMIAEEDRVVADAAVQWLRRYMLNLLVARRPAPGGDLLSRLLDAEGANALTEEELVDNAVFLFFAGFETSMNLLASGCALLAQHRQAFERLRAEPALLPGAIDEFARYDAPTQLTARLALEALEIDGQSVSKGRVVLLMLASANRDERQFSCPDQLDIGRSPNPHVSFGSGIHYCLGAGLARMEGVAFLERLIERCAVIECSGEPRRTRGATIRPYTSLPVAVKAR